MLFPRSVLLFSLQALILVSSVSAELSFLKRLSISKIRRDDKGFSKHQICSECNDQGIDMTVAYTDPSRAIKTFKVNSKELTSFFSDGSDDTVSFSNDTRQTVGLIGDGSGDQSQEINQIDPVKRKRQLLRQKRREQRTLDLIQMSKETELEITNSALERTKNFVNRARDRYSIWRIEYQNPLSDSVLKLMKDQIIMAKVYASIYRSNKENVELYGLLVRRIKENQYAIGDAISDNELHEGAMEKAKAMGHTLSKAKDLLPRDSADDVARKMRAMLQSAEQSINSAKRQNTFLVQHAAKTVPRPLHCLQLQLTTDYYSYHKQVGSKSESGSTSEYEMKLKDRSLYHYAIFSDNVLATSVVVNSTVLHAREPYKHVFHIVTDQLNYAAMEMWFQLHLPRPATVQVEKIDDFSWLNSSYCSVLRQLESNRIKEYYFKVNHPSSLSVGNENLKYRNPKYLSMLNHLRFYMPEVYPDLNKILFLDDDVVVQRDLTPLWSVDLKGMVNGAVETCKESFHRFDTYLNFSNPKISENFDPRACGWAFGMNMFDLVEWKRRNITGIYHYWQDLNEDRKLWKLGSLPPGLITFYNLTYPLDRSWHVLGLGYDPAVDPTEIEKAGVIHYNGNYKPWLDLAIAKYKPYWSKYVRFDNPYIQQCFMND